MELEYLAPMKVMIASRKGMNAIIRDFSSRSSCNFHIYPDHWHAFGLRPDALLHGSFYPQGSLAVLVKAFEMALRGLLLVGMVWMMGLYAVRAQGIVLPHRIRPVCVMVRRLETRSSTAVSAGTIDADWTGELRCCR